MADPKTKSTDSKVVDEEGPISKPSVGDADAAYIDPDLSGHEDTGVLPDEEKEWHEARNKAQEEGVEAAEEQEDKAVKERRKQAQEEAKEREEERERLEKAGAIPPTTKSPGPSQQGQTQGQTQGKR